MKLTDFGEPSIPADVARDARQLGPLESPLIWAGFACLTLLLVIVVVIVRHRRRARRRAVTAALCFLLLTGITGLNSYVGYVRTVGDLGHLLDRGQPPVRAIGQLLDEGAHRTPEGRPPHHGREPVTSPAGPESGTVEVLDLPDPARGVPTGKTYVLLPAGYADPAGASSRYPVVYLIHGYPYGSSEDWLTAGGAATTRQLLRNDRAIAPMIIVSVDLTAGAPSRDWEGLDVPGGPQLETYLVRTVVPQIDRHYRTIADRAHRALGGMSGGAFAALNIGLHHVGQFGTLLLALPYDTLGDDAALLGGDPRLVAADTPRDYLPTMTFTGAVAVILTAGAGAPTDVATARRIAADFRSRGQDAVVHVEPGFNHTWHTARATLPYLLVFADHAFSRA